LNQHTATMGKPAKDDQSDIFNNYLAQQEDQFKPALTELRLLIRAIAPDLEETFSYQVHCFKTNYMLVGIGANKKYVSLYTMSPPLIKQMKTELGGCKVSGATLHFKPGESLPVELITKIVQARKRENEELALERKKAK
jgi:uncharacterized protein YdhG (YjbR/CyaY superfamily)